MARAWEAIDAGTGVGVVANEDSGSRGWSPRSPLGSPVASRPLSSSCGTLSL